MPAAHRPAADDPPPIRPRHERRKDARPGELLDAALDLFVEKGFAATRSEEVAARAGVSKGTLFLYFPTKDELFKAVVVENLRGEFAEWSLALEQYEGSTADMLRRCLRLWWERFGSTKASGLIKLMLSEGRNFPELADFYRREVIDPRHELLRRIVERGIASGEFAPADVNHAIRAIVAPMILLALHRHSPMMSIEGPQAIDADSYLAFQAETLLHGLCARGPIAA